LVPRAAKRVNILEDLASASRRFSLRSQQRLGLESNQISWMRRLSPSVGRRQCAVRLQGHVPDRFPGLPPDPFGEDDDVVPSSAIPAPSGRTIPASEKVVSQEPILCATRVPSGRGPGRRSSKEVPVMISSISSESSGLV
jgi:hypothetical protein